MISFIGEYESTIDLKGRFLLPTGLKKQLPGEDNSTFVINRGFEKCLTLFPIQTWKSLSKDISQLNDFDPQVRDFRRKFFNGATQIELDNAGRLLLPKTLMEYASLQRDIVLVSAINKLEIWDKNEYKQLFESFSPAEFSKLADEVMSPKVVRLPN